MTYFVYKRRKHLTGNCSAAWKLISKHENLEEAEKTAEYLLPDQSIIYTEPSEDLQKAFFGSPFDKCVSMITIKDIHNYKN